jgi:Domain of unknown function (DUF4440)
MKAKPHPCIPVLVCLLAFLLAPLLLLSAPPDADPAILQLDRTFLRALSKADASKLVNLLDRDFTWTDSQGHTLTLDDILHSAPNSILGLEPGTDVSERTYGQVAAVTANSGKVHLLRLWVRRPAGWRLLVYHAVTQLPQPPTSSGSGVNTCENPCKSVPFKPSNDAQRAIIASWQALETGVTAHDSAAWAPHIAEEFVQVSSNSDHPIYKKDRMATLDKQKASGVGSAPSPLVSARMFDFGDSVVMTCLHQPYSGKPIHVTRLWIKRDGHWVMVISYQTAIQAGASKTG